MAWSFDASLSTDKDLVRFKIGDTNTGDQLVANETIQAFLDNGDSVVDASIKCVTAIIAKLAREYDRSEIGMSASRSQAVQHYRDLLKELNGELGALGNVSFGGDSVSDKDTIEDNDDFKGPLFERDQHTNKSSL